MIPPWMIEQLETPELDKRERPQPALRYPEAPTTSERADSADVRGVEVLDISPRQPGEIDL